MATTTTCTLAASTVAARYLHEGTVTLSGKVTLAGSAADGDVYLLCKIPHGATVVDGWYNLGASDGAAEMNLGFAGNVDDEDAILASVSASNVVHHFGASKNTPIKVSVTDNVRNQFAFLAATVGSATSSATWVGTMHFSVQYNFDMPVS